MAQVTIYLDKETEEKMRAYAKAKNISQSQWVASLIREKLQSEWPDHVAALSGAWKDFPSLEEIRAEINSDIVRESM
jgi:hypothetical protein